MFADCLVEDTATAVKGRVPEGAISAVGSEAVQAFVIKMAASRVILGAGCFDAS